MNASCEGNVFQNSSPKDISNSELVDQANQLKKVSLVNKRKADQGNASKSESKAKQALVVSEPLALEFTIVSKKDINRRGNKVLASKVTHVLSKRSFALQPTLPSRSISAQKIPARPLSCAVNQLQDFSLQS